MFIRWQKRKRRDGVTRLNAILCESRRVDGKPRQEHIAYLGAIDDVWLDEPLDDPGANLKRYEFWEKAEKRLAPLANRLASDDHHKIRKQLNAKVPMADTNEAHKEHLRQRRVTSQFRRLMVVRDGYGTKMAKMQVENREYRVKGRAGLARLNDAIDDKTQELLGVEGEEYDHKPVEEFDELFDKEEGESIVQETAERMAKDSADKGA
jgi:hypothetical protein